MDAVFSFLLNRSITAGWLILAVMILRKLLKKAPKSVSCLLWVLVGVRLVCPFSIESAMSLVPKAQVIQPSATGNTFRVDTGLTLFNGPVNNYLGGHYYEGVTVQAGTRFHLAQFCTAVWLIGLAALLLYSLVSYLRLRRQMSAAVCLEDGVWQCDRVASPFILGLFRPRIYLPFHLPEADMAYVLAHERAHLRRRDHWIKPIGFLILAAYWFNPLVWAAYVLLCRDIELACDERVIRQLGGDCKAAYSQALLHCSCRRRTISACPLAFGEVGVKQRVKSILNYKRPAFWVVLVSLLACAAVAVCFLTDPKEPGAPAGEDPPSAGTDHMTIANPLFNTPPPTWTDEDTLKNMWEYLELLSYRELGEEAEMGPALELRLTYGGETYALSVDQAGVGALEGVDGLVDFGGSDVYDYLRFLYNLKTGGTVYVGGALLYQSMQLSFLPVDGSYYANVIEEGDTLLISGESGEAIFIGELKREKSYSRKAFLSVFDAYAQESSDQLEAMVPQAVDKVNARLYYRASDAEGIGAFTIWELCGGDETWLWLGEGELEPLRLYELIAPQEVFPQLLWGLNQEYLWTRSSWSPQLPIQFSGDFISGKVWVNTGTLSLEPIRLGVLDAGSEADSSGVAAVPAQEGSQSLDISPGDTIYWDPGDDASADSPRLSYTLETESQEAVKDHLFLQLVSRVQGIYGSQTYGAAIDWLGVASSRVHFVHLSADSSSGCLTISLPFHISLGTATLEAPEPSPDIASAEPQGGSAEDTVP